MAKSRVVLVSIVFVGVVRFLFGRLNFTSTALLQWVMLRVENSLLLPQSHPHAKCGSGEEDSKNPHGPERS